MKHYFYTDDTKFIKGEPNCLGHNIYEIIVVDIESERMSEAEDYARAYARKLGKTLAGGYTNQKPLYGDYIYLDCPKDIVPEKRPRDIVDFIMEYESGESSEEDIIKNFQQMIDDGTARGLQGSYGRKAQQLINDDLCHA